MSNSGGVQFFDPRRGYGFITLDGGGRLFFYVKELLKAGMEMIDPGVRVVFERGVDKYGRPKVSKFLEIGGNLIIPGSYKIVDGKFVMIRYPLQALRSQLGHVSSSAELNARTPSPVQPKKIVPKLEPDSPTASTLVPSVSTRSRPSSDEGVWQLGTIRRIQTSRGGYVMLESGDEVAVPAFVIDGSGLRNLKKGQAVRIRIPRGARGNIVAVEISPA